MAVIKAALTWKANHKLTEAIQASYAMPFRIFMLFLLTIEVMNFQETSKPKFYNKQPPRKVFEIKATKFKFPKADSDRDSLWTSQYSP